MKFLRRTAGYTKLEIEIFGNWKLITS
jgi:hypothetical protein